MEIKLIIDEKEKTFVAPFVKGMLLRRTLQMNKFFASFADRELEVEDLDKMVDYVVEVFGNKFTRDDVYNGVEIGDIMFLANKYMQEITDKATSKMAGIEKNV